VLRAREPRRPRELEDLKTLLKGFEREDKDRRLRGIWKILEVERLSSVKTDLEAEDRKTEGP
jgi:hypothetical protein